MGDYAPGADEIDFKHHYVGVIPAEPYGSEEICNEKGPRGFSHALVDQSIDHAPEHKSETH